MASKFSQGEVTFKDKRGCGGITVRGIQLETDKDGYIEAPLELEEELRPHGFEREERKPSTLSVSNKRP